MNKGTMSPALRAALLVAGLATTVGAGAAPLPARAVDTRVAARQQQDPQSIERGRALFRGRGNCAACHGNDAKGTALAPNLTDTVWINVQRDVAALQKLIQTGVPKPVKHPTPMPPKGGANLTEQEVLDLARYIFSLGAETGKALRR